MICSPQDILGHPQDIPHRIKIYPVGYVMWVYPVDDTDISCGGRIISCGVYPVECTIYPVE